MKDIIHELREIHITIRKLSTTLITNSNNDFNIIKIMLGFLPLILYLQESLDSSSPQYLITWIIAVILIVIILIWGTIEFLTSKTLSMMSLRWITAILIIIAPLFCSIIIALNWLPNYLYLKPTSIKIIILYATILSLQIIIRLFKSRVIDNK